jgi:transposase
LGVAVAGANVNDHKLLAETLSSVPLDRPAADEVPQHLCGDKGYDYPGLREHVQDQGYLPHIPLKQEPTMKPKRRPGSRARRWVVERTHSWMNRFRCLLIRWEKKAENYETLIHLACAIFAFQRAGVFG